MYHDQRGRLVKKSSGYSQIMTAGGRDFWVEDRYVIYPEADPAPYAPWDPPR